MDDSAVWVLALAWIGLVVGCGGGDDAEMQRRPRPVATRTLVKSPPPAEALVTASAGAWKTEDLGFEVSGRVEFVAEQNAEIQGRVRDDEGNLLFEGTPLARVESERYELAVASAKASVARAEQDLIVAETDLDETIPAQIDAASSSVELAKIEYDRNVRLRRQNANSQSDLDTAKANLDSATAELKQLIAAEKSQKAQIESLKSGVLQAQQSLRDAERDLEDCVLFSSFDGKVTDTSVVPGSMVNAGAPVATLQMMDPIKIELEVSGAQSRALQRTETLPIHITLPDGTTNVYEGFLHQIDPSADPSTRTFTLTILMLNQQVSAGQQSGVAITRDIWRLDLKFIPGAQQGTLFVEESAILSDGQGDYLWQITNATIQSRSPTDQILEVRKLRVQPGALRVPYLGEYIFRQVDVLDDEFDPSVNIVIGELIVDGIDPNQWNGTEVLLESEPRWMLRPGDLVKVDLSGGTAEAGFYVPMDAIARNGGESFLFIVEDSADGTAVRRVGIDVLSDASTSAISQQRRVAPRGGESLDGRQYVTKGTHFLVDGERVSVVNDSETQR
ncbi:MAG: HlyD family efflux transporter periplasmic adaptor subunit [Planctomycetota bacterium]